MTSPQPLRRDLLLILVLGILFFLVRLGERDIWYSPEARVAQVARQMRQNPTWHNLVVPHLGDKVRIKKPPLAYWLVLLASLPFDDVDEFNSRLPNAIAAIGLMLIMYLLTLHLFDRKTGLIASLLLATTGFFWIQARQTGIELPMLFFNASAIYCWWRYRNRLEEQQEPADAQTGGGAWWLLLCYTSLGLSFLEKGPVGPLLVLLIIWLWLFASGEWRRGPYLLKQHLIGIGILLLLALPWYVAVWIELPEAITIWLHESAGRAAGVDHIKELTYYLRKIPGDGLPWVLVAFLSPFIFATMNEKARMRLLLPTCWAAGCLIFFTFFASKKSYYMLPVYPSLAMLAAVVIMQCHCGTAPARVTSVLRWLMTSIGAVLCLAGIAACLDAIAGGPLYRHLIETGRLSAVYASMNDYLIPTGVTALTGGIAIIVFSARKQVLIAAALLICVTGGGFGLYTCTIPERNRHKGTKLLAATLKPRLGAKDKVFIYLSFAPEVMEFHLNHHVERARGELQLRNLANSPEQIYILFSEGDFADLPPVIKDNLQPLPQKPLPSRRFWAKQR